MKKKQSKKEMPSAAAKMMESFIENGHYPHLKQTEKKIKVLTSSMKERLEFSESKRHEFNKYQLVGRFIAKNVYDTDVVSLNEYLHDLGLLLHVVEIDNKKIQEHELYLDMIQDFKLEETFYVKPNFNKKGKALNNLPSSFEVTDQWSLQDMARTLSILKPQVKSLNYQYENLKRKMVRLHEFESIRQLPKELRKPIPHKYGSLSFLANPAKYDIPAVYDYIGEWLLIEYGVPNYKLIENFILSGTITKKEIDQFKILKDIRLEFTTMSMEDERRLFEMLDKKQQIAASNRLGA